MIEYYGTSASCSDDPDNLGEATCGILEDPSGSYIRYSEGFCCMCSPGDILSGTRNRAGIDCGDMIDALSRSFHCIKPDKLWYTGEGDFWEPNECISHHHVSRTGSAVFRIQ